MTSAIQCSSDGLAGRLPVQESASTTQRSGAESVQQPDIEKSKEEAPPVPRWLAKGRRGWRRVVQNFTPSWVQSFLDTEH
jgi:hypothetical protein